MHGVTGYPFSGSSIRSVLFLIKILISFKFSFNQDFLTSAGDLMTSEKLLGCGMRCDTYEPDYPKVGNELFNSFKKTALKTLCKPLPILFSDSSSTFH